MAAYLIFWMVNLPEFYRHRIVPYTSQEIVGTWEQNGKLTLYVYDGSKRTLDYVLREYPEINIAWLLSEDGKFALPEPPFFLVAAQWPLENSLWYPELKSEVETAGYIAKLIMVRDAAYPVHRDYIQSLYFPANGLWIYLVTKEGESRL